MTVSLDQLAVIFKLPGDLTSSRIFGRWQFNPVQCYQRSHFFGQCAGNAS